jgi:hypothetical protein
MKKTGLFLALAVLLCAGLSSCNSDNNYDGTPTPLSWVDLGLPSGLLWASQNQGALSPVDYGDYFAWGEKTPKEVYGWETYAYGYDWNRLIKYCCLFLVCTKPSANKNANVGKAILPTVRISSYRYGLTQP